VAERAIRGLTDALARDHADFHLPGLAPASGRHAGDPHRDRPLAASATSQNAKTDSAHCNIGADVMPYCDARYESLNSDAALV
jgi:hypothetical protein